MGWERRFCVDCNWTGQMLAEHPVSARPAGSLRSRLSGPTVIKISTLPCVICKRGSGAGKPRRSSCRTERSGSDGRICGLLEGRKRSAHLFDLRMCGSINSSELSSSEEQAFSPQIDINMRNGSEEGRD